MTTPDNKPGIGFDKQGRRKKDNIVVSSDSAARRIVEAWDDCPICPSRIGETYSGNYGDNRWTNPTLKKHS
jgi:hypothetical protein